MTSTCCRWTCLLACLVWPGLSWAGCTDALNRLEALQSVVVARHAAQDALVGARRSAQDFKNLLLRGSDPVKVQVLSQRFEDNAHSYKKHLATLYRQLLAIPSEEERAKLLEQERELLFGGYRKALQTHDVRQIEEALAADKAVLGSDVKTFRALEQTIESLNAQTDEAFQKLHFTLSSCVR